MAKFTNNEELNLIIYHAEDIMYLFTTKISDNPEPDKKGGFLTVVEKKTKIPLCVVKIGEMKTPEEAKEHLSLSIKKAFSCLELPEREEIGAIETFDYILSFSGLSEFGNEIIVLMTAYKMHLVCDSKIRQIAKKSNNPFYAAMHCMCW